MRHVTISHLSVQQVPSRLLAADVDVLVLSPPVASPAPAWLWLLHGHSASIEDMRPVLRTLEDAMADGRLRPYVVAAPDAPWSDRAGWWVDGVYPLESALLDEVLPALEARLGPPASRQERMVGGISMGGAGALRYALVHREMFGAAALLSPAVYSGSVPDMSSVRSSEAFASARGGTDPVGRFADLLDFERLLAARPVAGPSTRVATVTGDREPVQDAGSQPADLDLCAARLHAALKRRTDLSTSLRILGGGHDWSFWAQTVVDVVRRADGAA